MSVSLRIKGKRVGKGFGMVIDYAEIEVSIAELKQQHPSLFPTQLTEEEVQQKTYYILEHKARGITNIEEVSNVIASALIGKCGNGLSDYEIAKRIGGVKFWCAKDDTLKDLVGLKGLKQIIDALATPTFSGEKE